MDTPTTHWVIDRMRRKSYIERRRGRDRERAIYLGYCLRARGRNGDNVVERVVGRETIRIRQ